MAASLAERMVIEHPPAPVLSGLARTPESKATLITDRVGKNLTKIDRVMFMQNNMASDFWQLARMIGRNQVNVNFR